MGQLKDGVKFATSFLFGDLAVIFRMLAVMLGPMLLAAVVGYGAATGIAQSWSDLLVGGLVGLGLWAALWLWSFWPWRRWRWFARIMLVFLALLTLLVSISAVMSVHRARREGRCSTLYSCVRQPVAKFWDEAND